MESWIFAVVVGVTVWLFFRNARVMRERRRQQTEARGSAGNGPPPEQKSMPRFGVPRSITREQMKRLRENDFEPHREWSKEEAQLILDTVTYLRAAIRIVTGETNAPIEVQNSILSFILGDDALRENVLDWSLNRTHEEEDAGEDVELPADQTFQAVEAHIRKLWEDA
jgi:hypothetical protein